MTFRYAISKDFTFSASHQLSGLPEGHQCARLHGHNYVVRLTLFAALTQDQGMVYDYAGLAPFGRFLDERLDHRHLNDVLPPLGGPPQPTAENMALWLYQRVRYIVDLPDNVTGVSVSISETPKTWATAGDA